VAPLGNQAANGENRRQPVAMRGPGLLEKEYLDFFQNILLLQYEKAKLMLHDEFTFDEVLC